nr:DUF111 family protein [Neobacillus kokaensis]
MENINRMKDILFRETTTLGIRYSPLTVHRLERVPFPLLARTSQHLQLA